MAEGELVSLVIQLTPCISRPIKAAHWYGGAVHAEIYKSFRRVFGKSITKQMHENQTKPFTSSSLFEMRSGFAGYPNTYPGVTYPEWLSPGKLYFLRITGLTRFITDFLEEITQVGREFGIGSVVKLANHEFIVEMIYWNANTHPLAILSSYSELLGTIFTNGESNDSISYYFHSPFTTKAGDFYNPLLSKQTLIMQPGRQFHEYATELEFQRFIDRTSYRELVTWKDKRINGEYLPKSVMDYYISKVFITSFKLSSQTVIMDNLLTDPITSGMGWVKLSTDNPSNQKWKFLKFLAAYSFFSGIGKETTRGLGQVWVTY